MNFVTTLLLLLHKEIQYMLTKEDKMYLAGIVSLLAFIFLMLYGDDTIIQINDMLKALHY